MTALFLKPGESIILRVWKNSKSSAKPANQEVFAYFFACVSEFDKESEEESFSSYEPKLSGKGKNI